MKLDMLEKQELPDGITAAMTDNVLVIKGPSGEVSRKLNDPSVTMKAEGNTVTLSCKQGTKRQKRVINSYRAHIRNMITGVQTPYIYKLKICSGHFPIQVSMSEDTLAVKNFLGEKSPRTLRLKQGATVKIDGDIITVESPSIEIAGNVASQIEYLTAKRGRDLRIFQDGIYIIEKAGTAQ